LSRSMTRDTVLFKKRALITLDFLVIAGAPDRRQLAYKQLPTKIRPESRILLEPSWILASPACTVASGVGYLDPTEVALSRNRSRE
jgi:hypothetical protein